MKVMHISSPKTWRGGEQQLIYLVEELEAMEVNQLIMCPFNSAVHKYCLKKHIAHVTYFKGFSGNPMVAFRVAHVCKRERVDLIHVHDSHAHNFAVLSAVLANNTVPLVVSRRVDFPIQDTKLSLFKYNHPRIKRIVCVSNAIKTIMNQFIEDKSKLTVVHSGVDLKKFEGVESQGRLRSENNLSDDQILIGNVAALAPHKDYGTFIRAGKRLIEAGVNAHFFAIGEGPSRKEIENEIKASGMEDHITLTGFRTDVLELLAELDIFLITSETEGLGTSILDALAMGKPVVATKAGGIIEVIDHESNGLLCPVKDDKAISIAVQRLIENKEMQEAFIQKGREKVSAFSKEATAQKTLKIYEEILASSSED